MFRPNENQKKNDNNRRLAECLSKVTSELNFGTELSSPMVKYTLVRDAKIAFGRANNICLFFSDSLISIGIELPLFTVTSVSVTLKTVYYSSDSHWAFAPVRFTVNRTQLELIFHECRLVISDFFAKIQLITNLHSRDLLHRN